MGDRVGIVRGGEVSFPEGGCLLGMSLMQLFLLLSLPFSLSCPALVLGQ